MKQNNPWIMRSTIGIALILLLSIMLAACQPAVTPTPLPTEAPVIAPTAVPQEQAPVVTKEPEPVAKVDLSAQLVGPLWLLLGYGDALNPTVVETGVTVTVQFMKDGSLSGFGGCNNFFGSYQLTGDEIKIDPLGSTMMACEKGMNQEAVVLQALEKATKVTFTSTGRLEIVYDPGLPFEHKLIFVPSSKSLVDTFWLLESFGKPDDPHTPVAGTFITAQFAANGTLSGDSGCNHYTTSFTTQDGRMQIAMPASTMRACDKGMEQESVFQHALMQAESYIIHGSTLEINYDRGQGVLRFTANHLPLENVLWTLESMNGERNKVGLLPTTVLFEPGTELGKGRVGGGAMCNNYGGNYTLENDQLKINTIVTTRVACPENVMQTEATYIELLETAQSYKVLGETLTITSEKGTLTFSAKRDPLEGTYWRLTSMGPIDAPTIPSQDADFTAQFIPQEGGPSGLIIGSTGCNDYNAAYVANLKEIKVNLPNKTNNAACPSAFWEQEQQFFLGLNAATTYRILGNTLQIPYDEGHQALNFVAFVPEIPPAPSGGALTPLNRTRWWLVMIGPQLVLPGTETTAEFAINADGQSGTISGNAGCNTYNAPITGVLTFGPSMVSNMFCPEPSELMNQEHQYLTALSTASSFTMAYNQLLIGTRNGLLVYHNQPAPLQPIPPTEQPPQVTEEPPAPPPTEEPPVEPTAKPPVAPTAEPTVEPTAEPPAVPPTAVISAPATGAVDQPILFDGSQSTATGGSIKSYAWDFGDGGKAYVQSIEHKFAKAGTYMITLTVTDSNGKTAKITHTITIK